LPLLTTAIVPRSPTSQPPPGEYQTVYNLRVEDYHTYFVSSEGWDFSVWSHNDSCDSKKLGKALKEAKERKSSGDHQAAHLVPTGDFSNRKPNVQRAIDAAQKALEFAGIDINSAENGFWAKRGHKGTHRNKYFLELGETLTKAKKEGKQAVRDALADIKAKAKAGVYRGAKYRN
jgi:hypothetical protein